GKKRAGIFHVGAALERRFKEIAELRGNVADDAQAKDLDPRGLTMKKRRVGKQPIFLPISLSKKLADLGLKVKNQDCNHNAGNYRSNRPFPALVGTHDRGQLALAKIFPYVVRGDVAGPNRKQYKDYEDFCVGTKADQQRERSGNVNHAEDRAR